MDSDRNFLFRKGVSSKTTIHRYSSLFEAGVMTVDDRARDILQKFPQDFFLCPNNNY